MTQHQMVIEHLNRYGSITDLEAYRDYAIRRLAAVIWDLRHKYHFEIDTKTTVAKNRFGETTSFATYILVDKCVNNVDNEDTTTKEVRV